MKKMLLTRLFNLLVGDTSTVVPEIQYAYEDFEKEVVSFSQSEIDYSIIFRTLNLTRIEFQFLHSQILYEQEKKCS